MLERRQLLVDITVLAGHDDKSGVQRVVRNILHALQERPPEGVTVAPVRDAGHGYYIYADDCPEPRPVAVREHDVFLGLDLAPNHIPGNLPLLRGLHRHGVRMVFVVYDLLPVRQPDKFVDGAAPWFANWIDSVAQLADGLLCISKAVADDLLDWLDQHPAVHAGELKVGWFHLGGELDPAQPPGAPDGADTELLDTIGGAPALLMVGTLEPRKRHALALDAFELLWARGVEARLVIVGRQGWMVDQVAERLRSHVELGRRLFWCERAGDALLDQLYARSAGLLAVSSGEGFGLPLIEAARHGLPVVAHALPVFREVAGEHAYFVDARDAGALADQLAQWLDLWKEGRAPASNGMRQLSWQDSRDQLVDAVFGGRWYRRATTRLP